MGEKGYYKIRKSVFWACTTVAIMLITALALRIMYLQGMDNVKAESERTETIYMEYGNIKSKLENTEECYLCGNSNRSLMGYYRKFDTVGIIGLNEWYVLDLRLKEYDGFGNLIEDSSGTSDSFGNTSGMNYNVKATPSRGMASATISSSNGMFNKEEVQNNLCQECLDKVTDTLKGYFEKGKEEYLPFCLVDFSTLNLYPVQKMDRAYSVGDYWIEMSYTDSEVEIDAYYLPER